MKTTTATTIDKLPFPAKFGTEHAIDVELLNKCFMYDLDGATKTVPAGTIVKLSQHTDYGLVLLPKEFGKRIYRV